MVEYLRLAVTAFAMVMTVYLARYRCSSSGCQMGMFAGTAAFVLLVVDDLVIAKILILPLLGEIFLTVLVSILLLIFFVQAVRHYDEL